MSSNLLKKRKEKKKKEEYLEIGEGAFLLRKRLS